MICHDRIFTESVRQLEWVRWNGGTRRTMREIFKPGSNGFSPHLCGSLVFFGSACFIKGSSSRGDGGGDGARERRLASIAR